MTTEASRQGPTVFVLGAGFTRAFVPNAPLMIDDYNVDELIEKFANFRHASRVLEWEFSQNENGQINIERLMTRLDGGMPYDLDLGAELELRMLSAKVKNVFLQRVNRAREGEIHTEELAAFANYCVTNEISCITFNYDDVLDQALYEVRKTEISTYDPYWHPDGGYGFFCRPALLSVRNLEIYMDTTSMPLLKLHGSINWRPIRGYSQPYAIDAITHFESWRRPDFSGTRSAEDKDVEIHLEPDPFIVPPVLLKSALVEQPILRLVWHKAYQALERAQEVVFIGYSFPTTDIATRVLFHESLQGLNNIHVVNFAQSEAHRNEIMATYREMFSELSNDRFDFNGALEWSQQYANLG